MGQDKFFNFKEYVAGKYKRVSTNELRFQDVHWMNFGFGEEVDEASNVLVLPNMCIALV